MVDWQAWIIGGIIFDMLSGALFIAFGLFVGLKRPRTRAGAAAATFAIGLGILGIGSNANNFGTIGHLDPPQDTGLAILASSAAIIGLSIAALGGVRLVALQRRGRAPRRLPHVLLAIAAASTIAGAWNAFTAPSAGTDQAWIMALSLVSIAMYAAVTPVLLWMAASLDGLDRASNLIALALVPFAVAWTLTRIMTWYGTEFFPGLRLAFLSVFVAIAIFAIQRRASSQRLFAWTVAWSLAAFLWGWAFQAHNPTDLGLNGLTRFLAVFVLGYAVVRHRAFDLDVRLRFTVKQSTIAAVFVAVFVGVQSLAGEFITAEVGLVAGAVATTVLVFALAPLQRFGERVADRAMPHAKPIGDRTSAERARLYVDLASAAWADGMVTAKEANVLETARVQLGLTMAEAHAIDADVRQASPATTAPQRAQQTAS